MACNTFVFLWQVTLVPGDVLFVPKKWWHYVQSLDTSISINTWIELVSHCHNLQVNLIWTGPKIHIQILQTGLHTFLKELVEGI